MPQREVPLPRHGVRGVTHGGQAGAELAAILPEVTGPSGQFRHRQHIHLAFLAVRRYGMPEARRDWVEPDLLPFPWSPAQDSRAG